MRTLSWTSSRSLRLACTVSVVAFLSACSVAPEPFSQSEFAAKAASDRSEIFKDQEPLTGPLTLDMAFERVLKYNLDRRVKMKEEAFALGQTDLDRFDLLPKLAANAGYNERSTPSASRSRELYTQKSSDASPTYSSDRESITADLGLTWNILDFGVSYYTARQNADRALIAQERRRRTVQNLAQEVRFAFWRAAAAQVLHDRISLAVNNAEKALKDSMTVEAEGLRNPITSLRTQKGLLENIRQLESIEQELASAKSELASLVSLPPGSDFTLALEDNLPQPSLNTSLDEMEESALANNPDLREQDYTSRITVNETRKEILRLLPGISLSFSRQYDQNSFLAENQWTEAGAKVSWNLLNILSAPDRIDHAETAEDVAKAKRLALRMAVLAQVHVASSQFYNAQKQFQRSDRLAYIERRLADAAINQSQGGTQSEIERISAETSAIVAELRRYQSYALLQSAFGKVQATIGNDPFPTDLGVPETRS